MNKQSLRRQGTAQTDQVRKDRQNKIVKAWLDTRVLFTEGREERRLYITTTLVEMSMDIYNFYEVVFFLLTFVTSHIKIKSIFSYTSTTKQTSWHVSM